jgi:hypothetical protein
VTNRNLKLSTYLFLAGLEDKRAYLILVRHGGECVKYTMSTKILSYNGFLNLPEES